MDRIWGDLLQFINQLVSPDWGALVALVPLGLVGLVGLYLVWLMIRYAKAGPTRRGKRRMTPRPPAGVHAAEQSWAPIIASVACVALLFGIVLKGVFLVAGVTLLVLALLYWLREGMRDYDHVEHPASGLVPVPSRIPPPGVHMPGPSFRPLLISMGMTALVFGLVYGPWLLLAGGLMLAISMLQWLADARREYKGVVVADVTGHLPADPIPGYPRGTLAAFAVLFAGAVVLQSGILPPRNATAGTPSPSGPGASPSAAPASPGTTGQPAGSPLAGSPADVTVTAENVAFVGGTSEEHVAPADKAFTIAFTNKDAGIPHNIAIHDASGAEAWKGEIFPGVDTRTYQVTPLKAGSYTFVCNVHPTMTGTLVVR
jgi:plastocyanin